MWTRPPRRRTNHWGVNEKLHAASQQIAREAELLREAAFPSIMLPAIGFGKYVTAGGCKAFLEQVIEDAGNPNDPIERMMLEQLTLAHFRVARLHDAAAHAQDVEAVKAYNGAATRLQAEFRGMALAVKEYQGKTPKREGKSLKIFPEAA